MVLENYQEEDDQGSNKNSIDKVHLKGEHTELEENGMKEDIIAKKIDVTNVVRKDTLFEIANLLKWKVM